MLNRLWMLTTRKTAYLLVFYIVLSAVIMSFNKPETLRGLRMVVLQFIAVLSSAERTIDELSDLREENKNLRRKLFELSIDNQRLQEVLIENVRLRRLLQFHRESPFRYIPARVIANGQEATVRSLILDVGSRDSVRKNMPVVSDAGLVGKILKVDKHTSIAQILMDRNALVSARLQKSRETGVISWSGNFWLDLNYIPKDVEVEPGEVVITSGLSRIYPPGLKIGVVAEVQTSEYELFKKIKVKNAVNFNSLEEVFVLIPPDTLNREIVDFD